MTTLEEIKHDREFCSRWPYIWNKLQKVLLEEQREFSIRNRGKHAEIGQYVEFMQQLIDKLNQVDATVFMSESKVPQRPKLHNEHFKQNAEAKPKHAPQGV